MSVERAKEQLELSERRWESAVRKHAQPPPDNGFVRRLRALGDAAAQAQAAYGYAADQGFGVAARSGAPCAPASLPPSAAGRRSQAAPTRLARPPRPASFPAPPRCCLTATADHATRIPHRDRPHFRPRIMPPPAPPALQPRVSDKARASHREAKSFFARRALVTRRSQPRSATTVSRDGCPCASHHGSLPPATASTSLDEEWMVLRLVPTGACRNPMIAGVVSSWSSLVSTKRTRCPTANRRALVTSGIR